MKQKVSSQYMYLKIKIHHDAEEEKENIVQGFSKTHSSEPGQLDQIYVNKYNDVKRTL
jgi:hypothetical protein